YEGRAAAESLKTLSWRYAVGGEPFGLGMAAEGEVDTLFLRQISEVVEELRELDLSLGTLDEQQITQGMRRLRSAELLERKQAYERDRVVEQQGWYRRKSAWNSRRASQWTIAMLAIEIGGLASAILKAMGVIEGDLLLFSGVLLGSAFAWLETKQHRTLATAYAVTSTELASVRTKIAPQATEKHWAAFVAEAEGAFSREHTLWKASRGVRST
ncbi:MAG: SLATT domain-containing protein, partial [Acidobacteriota bacterium]|nr:SLATT domain-containing protein [Acidobacteriota bacterium]